MRKLIYLMAGMLAATVAAIGAGAQSTEQKILRYEEALGRAMIQKDAATLTALVGDDWTIQSESGSLGNKAGFIEDVKSGRLIVTSFKLHDMRIHVLGDVAYVQGFDDEVSSYDGKDNTGTYNWLDVWVKRDGKWVSEATQLTRVKK